MYSHKYRIHAKLVAIVEIILVSLSSISTLVDIGLILISGVNVFSWFSGITSDSERISEDVDVTLTGFQIGTLVVSVLVNIFEAWTVYLVFTGVNKEIPSRLTIWCHIESVLLCLGILFVIALMYVGVLWYMVTLAMIYVIYKIYSIHVVRCHANEIRGNQNFYV